MGAAELIELDCPPDVTLTMISIGRYVIYFEFDNGWGIENYGRIGFTDTAGRNFIYDKPDTGHVYEFTRLAGQALEKLTISINQHATLEMAHGARLTLFAGNQGLESVLINAGDVHVTLF